MLRKSNELTKSRTHAISAIDLRKLHPTNNQAGDNLTGALDNGIFGAVHVEAAHAAELLELLHADETFDAEGAKGACECAG